MTEETGGDSGSSNLAFGIVIMLSQGVLLFRWNIVDNTVLVSGVHIVI